MTQPSSPIVRFVFVHRWLFVALTSFGLGFLGVSFAASAAASEEEIISIASGICFFLSVVSITIWLYALGHQYNTLLPLHSTSIKELAIKKLVILLGSPTFFGTLLFWLFFLAALATPLSVFAARSFLPYALLLNVLAVGTVAGLFFLAQNRLLAAWFPTLICPHCQEQTILVNYWYCVGGCNASRARHVLSPCATCGTKLQGLACSNYYCGQAISFEEPYNEFEIANRGKKYVTQYNPFFWVSVLALKFPLLLLYISLQGGFTLLCILFGLIALALAVTLIVVKPKRLIRNQYYIEGAEQWTRSATA